MSMSELKIWDEIDRVDTEVVLFSDVRVDGRELEALGPPVREMEEEEEGGEVNGLDADETSLISEEERGCVDDEGRERWLLL
mmetsp:Transcript_25522/g.42003  ORF Transcript_25522/g.42003 Transcript_25522/m.42003 type:complete len:82 (-) Transcript_25522:962-1207(-)